MTEKDRNYYLLRILESNVQQLQEQLNEEARKNGTTARALKKLPTDDENDSRRPFS